MKLAVQQFLLYSFVSLLPCSANVGKCAGVKLIVRPDVCEMMQKQSWKEYGWWMLMLNLPWMFTYKWFFVVCEAARHSDACDHASLRTLRTCRPSCQSRLCSALAGARRRTKERFAGCGQQMLPSFSARSGSIQLSSHHLWNVSTNLVNPCVGNDNFVEKQWFSTESLFWVFLICRVIRVDFEWFWAC